MPRDAKLVPKPGHVPRASRRKSADDAAQASELAQGQCRVLEMIATGAPLGETLSALAGVIEAAIDGARASVLLLDEDGRHLHHIVAPALPEALRRLIDGFESAPPQHPAAGRHIVAKA